MGITYSTDSIVNSAGDENLIHTEKEFESSKDNLNSNPAPVSIGYEGQEDIYTSRIKEISLYTARKLLEKDIDFCLNLVNSFHSFNYPPVLSFEDMKSFFSFLNDDQSVDLFCAAWIIFNKDESCYIQEVLCTMILITPRNWNDRLSALYDLSICVGTDEMYREDIELLLHTAASGLGKFWREEPPQQQLFVLSEHLADLAVVKLNKELEEGIQKDEFIDWASGRFKATKVVGNMTILMKIYGSAHA